MKLILLSICITLVTSFAYAGMDFSGGASAEVKIPQFRSESEALKFALKHINNEFITVQLLERRAELKRDSELKLDLAIEAPTEEERQKAKESFQQIEFYDKILAILANKPVGSSVRAGSTPWRSNATNEVEKPNLSH